MFKLDRRTALGLGAASLAALKIGAVQAAAGPLRAVVTLNGATYEFREEQGRDMGDFSPGFAPFTQRCVRATSAGCPLTVFFRPDRTSDRVEVVFELGTLFSGTPAHLGAYSVQIFRGADVLATVDVPVHYWFSRWRWQSSVRPVVAAVSNLLAWDLLPPLARTAPANVVSSLARPASVMAGGAARAAALATTAAVTPVATAAAAAVSGQGTWVMEASGSITFVPAAPPAPPAPAPAAPAPAAPAAPEAQSAVSGQVYTAMGLAGITPYMPQTGERADIGLVTEPQAKFICTDDQASLQTLLAQAESAGTVPWHMRDENTGAPINLTGANANASWYYNQGAPHIKTIDSPVTIDSAHMPSLAYVPYILTGDPYYLEELQFQSNWDWGSLPPSYRPTIAQARQFAWSLRNLAQCARMTPASVPSWLLPASYWQNRLETTRQFFEASYVNGMSPERSLFRCCTPIESSKDSGPTEPAGTWVDPWEDEFVACVIGWTISMGFTRWQNAFNWKIGSTIARTNGTSGWVRANATPYRMILRYSASSPFARSWQEAFEITKAVQRLTVVNPDTWNPSDMTYLTYTRGALVYAQRYGTPGAAACLAWATGQIAARGWTTDYKWRLAV